MLWPHFIYVFCIYLRTNSDLCHLQHKLIGFYNRDEKCLQRGTDWVFKYSSLRFVCKGLIVRLLGNKCDPAYTLHNCVISSANLEVLNKPPINVLCHGLII